MLGVHPTVHIFHIEAKLDTNARDVLVYFIQNLNLG